MIGPSTDLDIVLFRAHYPSLCVTCEVYIHGVSSQPETRIKLL